MFSSLNSAVESPKDLAKLPSLSSLGIWGLKPGKLLNDQKCTELMKYEDVGEVLNSRN